MTARRPASPRTQYGRIAYGRIAIRPYGLVYAALLALLLVTVAAASRDLGPLNAVVALAVAVCQALLIVLYLMRVRSSGPLVWVVAGAGFFWLGIMLVLAMSDYVSRGWLGVPGK
jgi:caa(3)-type oxidase subunit IV